MPKFLLSIFLFVLAGLPVHLLAQKINDDYRLHIRKATSSVQIDGVMEEKSWLEADVADNFTIVTTTSNLPILEEVEALKFYKKRSLD